MTSERSGTEEEPGTEGTRFLTAQRSEWWANEGSAGQAQNGVRDLVVEVLEDRRRGLGLVLLKLLDNSAEDGIGLRDLVVQRDRTLVVLGQCVRVAIQLLKDARIEVAVQELGVTVDVGASAGSSGDAGRLLLRECEAGLLVGEPLKGNPGLVGRLAGLPNLHAVWDPDAAAPAGGALRDHGGGVLEALGLRRRVDGGLLVVV